MNQPSATNAARGHRRVGVADEAVGTAAPDLARLARRRRRCRRRRRAGSRRRAAARRRCAGACRAATSARAPVIDGCSVDPKLRVVVMPSCSARSPTAAGTAEPPSPITGISATCRSGIEVGMVEQAREEVRRALARRQSVLEHRLRAPGRDPTRRSGGSAARRYTGMSNAASIPMPWPTGAPVMRRPGRRASACMAPSWRISAPIVRCECMTPFGIGRRARRVRDERGRARVDRGRRRRAGSSATRSSNAKVRRPGVVADDRDPLEVGQIGAHRVEVGEEVVVAEAVGGDERLHARARAGCTRLPSARRSARSARRPRRGTRSRRTSPPPRASSGAGTRPRRRACTPRARSPAATRRASASTSPSVPRYGLRSERTVNGCAGGVAQPVGEQRAEASGRPRSLRARSAARVLGGRSRGA